MKLRLLFSSKSKKHEWRFNPLRTMIASLLIVGLFVSMSVGLSYSRMTFYSENPNKPNSYFYSLDLNTPSTMVSTYRAPGTNTVLRYNNEIVVSIPASADITETTYVALGLSSTPSITNTVSGNVIKVTRTYNLRLMSYAITNTNAAASYLNDASAGVSVQFKLDENYSNLTLSSNYSDIVLGPRALKVSGISQMSNTTTGRFVIKYDLPYGDTSWYDGSGSYSISTPRQLVGLAQLVNDGTDFDGETVKLSNDLSMYVSGSRLAWMPIGSRDNPFKGSFDAQGHTVSGLNINTYDSSVETGKRTSGFFGATAGTGTIKALTLNDIVINTNHGSNSIVANSASGFVVGYNNGTAISDVHVKNSTLGGRAYYIGGIVGWQAYNGSVTDCSVTDSTIKPISNASTGGIVGAQYGDGTNVNIKNCYVNATIAGNYSGAGGIVGMVIGDAGPVGVQSCYFGGTFTDDDADYGYGDSSNYGGIVNRAYSNEHYAYTINNCYCDAEIYGDKYIIASGASEISDPLTNDNVIVANSSWSGSVASYYWYTKAYEDGDTTRFYEVTKSDTCTYSAGMTYEQFKAATPAVLGVSRPRPTQAPTDASTDAPAAAPTQAVSDVPTDAEVTEAETEAPEVTEAETTAPEVAETEAEAPEVTEAETEAAQEPTDLAETEAPTAE